MLPRNIIHLFITLIVLLQVTVHGGILRELRRKILEIWYGKPPQKHGPPGPFYEKCNLCSWDTCSPAIAYPDKDFDDSKDTQQLVDALSSQHVVVDKEVLISILPGRTERQRNKIAVSYKQRDGTELKDKFMQRLTKGSAVQVLMTALATPMPLFYAQQFESAILLLNDQQITAREKGLITVAEMLTTLPKCFIDYVAAAYRSTKKKDFLSDLYAALEKYTIKETTEVIFKLLKEKRDDGKSASWFKALVEAFKLKGCVKSKNVENVLDRISDLFTKQSIPQIRETITVYENLRHGDEGFIAFHEDINASLKSGVKEVYIVMLRLFTNKPLYYANKIQKVLSSGNDRKEFIGIVRERCDIDLKDIIDEYNGLSNLKKDFDAWDNNPQTATFHKAMLKIIE